MNLPDYKPKTPINQFSSYEENVRQYGPAPRGWRWMKVGEQAPREADVLMASRVAWVPILGCPKTAKSNEYPFIVREAKAQNSLLRRMDDLRAKIAASQKLIVAESERLDKYAEVLKTLEGVK